MAKPAHPSPAPPRQTADRPVTITMTWTEALSWFDRHRVEVEVAYHDPRERAWVFIVKPKEQDNA